jgi:hypothetical protein
VSEKLAQRVGLSEFSTFENIKIWGKVFADNTSQITIMPHKKYVISFKNRVLEVVGTPEFQNSQRFLNHGEYDLLTRNSPFLAQQPPARGTE